MKKLVMADFSEEILNNIKNNCKRNKAENNVVTVMKWE